MAGGYELKLSLCLTVRNEQGSIGQLVDSLLTQTRVPDEIIIVDGGSTDGTKELLRTYAVRHPCLNIVTLRDINIAEGRNIAVANARYEYIVSADAGVDYPKSWLKNLVRALETDPAVDIVSGFFEPKPETLFEECVGEMLYPVQSLMNWSKFLPSCRSVAFKKRVWEELDGYAEWLPHGVGEDTHFFLRAQQAGFGFAYAPNATCYWRPRKSFLELYKQYFLYSKGAAISRSSSTFIFEAYGANAAKVAINNLSSLIGKGKLLHVGLSMFILAVVLMAKITGTIAGLMQRGRIAPPPRTSVEET